ncbi:YkgJ family cysteine cluster protein [Treponema putidum]|uniref:YkgJ family cysteine cluster protein n=1 Tax=Treponema putidum TaxID=221027 RepID=UPI00210610C3|nr:YkgJ family cysteine cluster protein [Treponema putidum]UTY31783.1 YkgJ family cysteine cluster protein [Treponema putidum]
MKQETESFKGTKTAEMILLLDKVYKEIEEAEAKWMSKCPIKCIDGCGACCVHFEPDVYEVEALYLASWLLFHQRERAFQILKGCFNENVLDKENGCLLFDIDNPYHCTVYGGRCLICRLFGYAGDRGKDFSVRWRPCKYLVSMDKNLSASKIKQYSQENLLNNFGTLPPVMSDFSSRILCFMTERSSHTLPLREALPAAISKILMLERYSNNPEFEPDTDPEMPPLAS